jgi:hypothetical protein
MNLVVVCPFLSPKLLHRFDHDFHFVEVVLILALIYGAGITGAIANGIEIPMMWGINIPLCSISGISTGYIWNLCTTKRLGLASENLEGVMREVGRENRKFRNTNDTVTNNNEAIQGKIALLESARVTLGKSVLHLEQVVEKQMKLEDETAAIIQQREEFQAKLEDIIVSENKHSAKAAEITVLEKVFALFDMYSDGGKLDLTPENVAALEEGLADLHIRDFKSKFGDRKAINKEEFSILIKDVISVALEELNDAMVRVRDLRRAIVVRECEISRLKEEISKRQMKEEQDKLLQVYQGDYSNMKKSA